MAAPGSGSWSKWIRSPPSRISSPGVSSRSWIRSSFTQLPLRLPRIDEPHLSSDALDAGVTSGKLLVGEKEVGFGIPADDERRGPELVLGNSFAVMDDDFVHGNPLSED